MGPEHGLCTIDIARKHPIRKILMCRDKILAAAQAAHHDTAITVGLIVEIRMRRQQPS